MSLPILYHHIQGKGTPLIILHGLLGSSDNWQSLARAWSTHFQVISVDLRNHGRSFHHHEMNYPLMAEDLTRLIHQLRLTAYHVIGHSMGGKLLMEYLKNPLPGLKRSMVLDISTRGYPGAHDRILNAMVNLPLVNLSSRGALDDWLSDPIPEFAIRQFILKNVVRDAHGKFIWRIHLEGILKNYPAIAGPILFQHPVLEEIWFLRGSLSNYLQDGDMADLSDIFKNIRLLTIEGAGHWIHVDCPELLSQYVHELME